MGATEIQCARLSVVLLACLATSSASAQPSDPKRAFTEALGRFSVALAGRFADDGVRITSSLAAMDEALARWDDAVRRSRASVAALIEKSPGAAAARIRVATALMLAERGFTSEAVGLLNEAITQSPRDVDAHTVLGLIHSQLVPNAAAAGNAFRQAVASDPAAPLQRYLLAKYLADQGATDEAAAVGLALRTDTSPGRRARSRAVRSHPPHPRSAGHRAVLSARALRAGVRDAGPGRLPDGARDAARGGQGRSADRSARRGRARVDPGGRRAARRRRGRRGGGARRGPAGRAGVDRGSAPESRGARGRGQDRRGHRRVSRGHSPHAERGTSVCWPGRDADPGGALPGSRRDVARRCSRCPLVVAPAIPEGSGSTACRPLAGGFG